MMNWQTKPRNFQDLPSFGSNNRPILTELTNAVNRAEQEEKWTLFHFHESCNDNEIIFYAATKKDIWGAPIGTVVKYILQRNNFVLNNYQDLRSKIIFSFSSLPIPPSAVRNFEDSFNLNDVITLKVDIDDVRPVSSVSIDGTVQSFFIKPVNVNKLLFINTPIAINQKTAEITYQDTPTPTPQPTPTENSGGGGGGCTLGTNANFDPTLLILLGFSTWILARRHRRYWIPYVA